MLEDNQKKIKSGHGGKRPNAGRKKGSRNKATDEQLKTITEIAQEHTKDAIETLVHVARHSNSDAARVSAANSILDRAYGKPVQGMELSGANGSAIETITEVVLVAATNDDSEDTTTT